MSKAYLKLKFPCGLEIESYFEGWFLTSERDFDKMVCPFHGQKCRKPGGSKK